VRPLAQADGHDAPWLLDEPVPGEAAVIDDVVVGFEDAVRQPVVAHELPKVLDWIELWAPRWQRHQCNVGRYDQFGRSVPASLIEQDHGVRSRSNVEGDFLQVHAHCLAVAMGHDDAGGLAFSRADGPEDPGRGTALVPRSRRAGAALCPASGELGLLADAGLVLPPQLYWRPAREPLPDLRQTGGELFLKTAMSSDRCPRWRGRAESLR